MVDLAKNQSHLVLINAIVEKEGKILISQRSFEESHEPGKWTVPGGKVDQTKGNIWNIIEKTLSKEVFEETGVNIHNNITLLANNTFIRSTGHHVIVLLFLCHWESGRAKPLDNTLSVRWISENDIDNFEYPPNVRTYIKKGFEELNP